VVGAPGVFTVASSWIRLSAVAIIRSKVELTEVARTETYLEF